MGIFKFRKQFRSTQWNTSKSVGGGCKPLGSGFLHLTKKEVRCDPQFIFLIIASEKKKKI